MGMLPLFMGLNRTDLTARNLCIDGGYDICAEMYNKNILAPLKTFIPKVGGISRRKKY